jgi:hypothetical protein
MAEHMALPVMDATTGHMLKHHQHHSHPEYKAIWDNSYANELGQLCQGIGKKETKPTAKCIEGTDTFHPIKHYDISPDRRHVITYTCVICTVRPPKEDPNQTLITIGGNRICYPGDIGTKTGSLELV